MNPKDLPINFVMALAQNETALKEFQNLSDEQKSAVADRTRQISSKREMKSFVDKFPDINFNLE
ncbi:MAG: hypothetical protein J1E81_01210 [Eubacterium sp.]|nr:hypothetical protein [Eubacterium sp.]